MAPNEGNGWNEYSRLVLAELKRLDSDIKILDESVKNLSVEIATLKVKSGVWGGVASTIVVIGYYVLQRITG